MNTRPLLLIPILLLMTGIGGVSQAGPELQSHAAILEAVQQFLSQQAEVRDHKDIQIRLGHLDPRLSLTACSEPLQTSLAPGARSVGKTTVGVRCAAPKPWGLYVPASVDVYQTVFETATNLPRGHVIAASDLRAVKHNLTRLTRGYYADAAELIGKETRRRLLRGNVITPSQVKAPLLVKQGQQVELLAKTDSYAVRMSGKAMMDGARGERIRVKNLSSSRIVEGIVTRSGQVTVLN